MFCLFPRFFVENFLGSKLQGRAIDEASSVFNAGKEFSGPHHPKGGSGSV